MAIGEIDRREALPYGSLEDKVQLGNSGLLLLQDVGGASATAAAIEILRKVAREHDSWFPSLSCDSASQ